MLKIELTEEQKILLKSYFEAIYHANQIGVGAAIAGQVWEDGLVVKLVSGESGRTLSAALGGKWKTAYSSAESRFSESHNALVDCNPQEELLSSDQIADLLDLNRHLATVESLIKRETRNANKSLSDEISQAECRMADFEVEIEVDYVLAEDDHDFHSDEENILTSRRHLVLPENDELDHKGWNDGRVSLNAISSEPHCYMLHDLYDHRYDSTQTNLSLSDCARVGAVWFDVVIRRQYCFNVKTGRWEKWATASTKYGNQA